MCFRLFLIAATMIESTCAFSQRNVCQSIFWKTENRRKMNSKERRQNLFKKKSPNGLYCTQDPVTIRTSFLLFLVAMCLMMRESFLSVPARFGGLGISNPVT